MSKELEKLREEFISKASGKLGDTFEISNSSRDNYEEIADWFIKAFQERDKLLVRGIDEIMERHLN